MGSDFQNFCDAELVAAAVAGEKAAFVEIVARHQALVCGTAYGILNDFTASEDAGQEAFLNAWRKIGDLREPEKLRPWLAQISRNVALGKLRGRRDGVSLDEIARAVDGKPLPDEVVASDEEAALVNEHLAKLPEKYRLPLVLFYREGKSVRAVAEALELSEDAVKKRLERGRAQLRERVVGVIESTLERTVPKAVFTMAVAAAIGALEAPAAVAAGAFGGAAAAATATTGAATSSSSGPVITAMTASQIPYVAAAIIAAVCLPLGYSAHQGLEKKPMPVEPEKVRLGVREYEARDAVEAWPDSELLAEWKRLHDVHGTDAEAMPLIFAEIRAMSDGFRKRAFMAAIVSEWAQLDPEGGFAALKGKKFWRLRKKFFHEWVLDDVDGAIAALLSGVPDWKGLARGELKEIARRRPGKVAALVAKLPDGGSFFNSEVTDAYSILASADREAAQAACKDLKGKNRQKALSGIARSWAKKDVDAAMAWVEAMPAGADRDEVMRHVIFGLAENSPLAALEKIKTLPRGGSDGYFASSTGARVLKVAVETDFDGTMAWLAMLPGGMDRDELEGVADAVTKKINHDTAAFLDQRLADGSLEVVTPAIYSAMMNGSAGNIGKIWEWLDGQEPAPELKKLREHALTQVAYGDPMEALEMAKSLEGAGHSEELLERFARALVGKEGRLAQFERIVEQTPEFLKGKVLAKAFERLSYSGTKPLQDPQSWAGYVDQLPAGERLEGVQRLARAWAGLDTREAVAWVETLGGEVSIARGTAGVVGAWSLTDPLGASQWIAAMPEGLQRDSGAQVLAGSIAEDMPSEAWQWAVSIGDKDMRQESLRVAVHRLADSRHRDVIDLRSWIDSAVVEHAEKEQLMKMLEESE